MRVEQRCEALDRPLRDRSPERIRDGTFVHILLNVRQPRFVGCEIRKQPLLDRRRHFSHIIMTPKDTTHEILSDPDSQAGWIEHPVRVRAAAMPMLASLVFA